ncbi:hypothetical protein Hanom_Chr15g01371651 [Helianthus anomalus]
MAGILFTHLIHPTRTILSLITHSLSFFNRTNHQRINFNSFTETHKSSKSSPGEL